MADITYEILIRSRQFTEVMSVKSSTMPSRCLQNFVLDVKRIEDHSGIQPSSASANDANREIGERRGRLVRRRGN